LTTAPRIKPTSIFLRSARRLNPGRGSTYRRGDSVQTTGTSSIYKEGFISLRTNEMNMDKVESVQVYQSILGRMLDYGTVTILGTGEGFETLRTIAGPIELRNSITGT